MKIRTAFCVALASVLPVVAAAQPYDFSAADALLVSELPDLDGDVAVIVRQDGVELYRFQAGDIDYDTKTRLASMTKTITAGVILSMVDDGTLALDERIGDTYPLFDLNGIGDATILDCWAMRQGIDSLIAYEHDARFTLAESIVRIGLTGFETFPPGTQLGYDGSGMQVTGGIAELRDGVPWESLARTRIFDRCDMPVTDYGQFAPNPAVAGGLRSTAEEIMNYLQMVIDSGWYGGQRVLSDAAVQQLFTNHTRGLPVYASPFPAEYPLYPYGVDPDYGFGGWVLAENPDTQHVEEIIGAGAWGSYVWLDQRRGLTATLITDVPPGTQRSMEAALGLCAIARQAVEAEQVAELSAVEVGGLGCLAWAVPAEAMAVRVYGADEPIRDIFDLRSATLLLEGSAASASVPPYRFYAVTAVFPELENTGLIPGVNASSVPTPRPDLDGDGLVGVADFELLAGDLGNAGPGAPGDVDGDGATDLADVAALQRLFGRGGC